MPRWILQELILSLKGETNFQWWYRLFLCQPMRNNRCDVSVKEVQDAVLNVPSFGSKFVNSIPQQIRFGPAQFVPQFGKTFDLYNTLVSCLFFQAIHPVDEWNGPIFILVENDSRARHDTSIAVKVSIIANKSQ
jgi:hypothetical protein